MLTKIKQNSAEEDKKAELVRISFAWLPEDAAEIDRLRFEFYKLAGRNPSKAEIVRAGLTSLVSTLQSDTSKFLSLVNSAVINRKRSSVS